jgi:hypothetical protein
MTIARSSDHVQAHPAVRFQSGADGKEPRKIEEFVKKNKAQLWIQHDYTAGIKRKIAPEFYE